MSHQSVTYNPPNVPEPQPQFSQVNTFVFRPGDKLVAITGQLAIQPDGVSETPKDFEDQVRLALQNLENCLKAAGASKRDIFKVTHHVVDFDPVKQNPSKVFIDWLGSDHRPASAMLPAFRLAGPDWKYDIRAGLQIMAGQRTRDNHDHLVTPADTLPDLIMASTSPAPPGEKPAPAVRLSSSETFFRYFQHEVTDLQQQMTRISGHSLTGGERSDAIDHCLSSIARLANEVQDASSYVPAYDQRTYGEAIKALNHKLQEVRQAHAPKHKFSFKSKSGPLFTAAKNESAISLNDAAEMAHQQRLTAPAYRPSDMSNSSSMLTTPASESAAEEENHVSARDEIPHAKTASTPADTTRFRRPSFSESKAVEITDHEDIHVVLPTAASHATSSGTVSNITHCVVDLSQPAADKPFAALYVKNISSSLIVCGHVSGAAMLTNIKDTVILVATRQFRMHDSSNCDVYLLATGRPIIENCSEVRFAPLPQAYMLDSDRAVENKWSDVDDFKWLRAEQSPHWSVMAPGKRVGEEVWRGIVPGGPETSVQDVLDAVNLPKSEI